MSAQERTRPSTSLQVLPAPPKVVTVVHEDGLFLGCLEGSERDRTAERLIEARIKSRARTGKIYTLAHYYRIGDVRTFERPSE